MNNNNTTNKTSNIDQLLNEKKNMISLLKLFMNILKINTFTFGGGYTIIPVLRDVFVFDLKLIDEEEMTGMVAIAQSAPGPMAVNASILVGYRLRGIKGIFVSLLAAVLPCLVIISTLYYVYASISENNWVKSAFSVMSGVISGILIVTTINMANENLKKYPIFAAVVMFSAFLISLLTSINTGIIVLISGLIGIVLFSLVEESKVR